MGSVGVVALAGCFVLVGLLTGAFFVYRIYQGVASSRWPSVPGELTSSRLKEVVYEGTDAGGGADRAGALVVDFEYRYSVAGQTYEGSRVTYSDHVNKTVGAVRKLQERYRGKRSIQVFYKPGNPSDSVLVPGLSIFNFTPLITSALFVLAGLFVLSLGSR